MAQQDAWEEIFEAQRQLIEYPWRQYKVCPAEVFRIWQDCYAQARSDQLQQLGVGSLGPWISDPRKDYDGAILQRLDQARNYFLEKVKPRLPREACGVLEERLCW